MCYERGYEYYQLCVQKNKLKSGLWPETSKALDSLLVDAKKSEPTTAAGVIPGKIETVTLEIALLQILLQQQNRIDESKIEKEK